jgi:hypothetical protein
MALMEPFTFSLYSSNQPNEVAADHLVDLATSLEQQQRESAQLNKTVQPTPIFPTPAHSILHPSLTAIKKAATVPNSNGIEQTQQSTKDNPSLPQLRPSNEGPLAAPKNVVNEEPRLSSNTSSLIPVAVIVPSFLTHHPPMPRPPSGVATAVDIDEQISSSTIQPTIMYRNLFHSVECQLPLSEDGVCPWEGVRVFIDDEVGYAGNAKLFKHRPDKGERALLLGCKVLDPSRRELTQCDFCREYFDNRLYFKANPHIRGRIVLIKSNNLILVENGTFRINLKYMCCCKHHGVSSYILSLVLTDNLTGDIVASALYPMYVKQWRKSTQKKQSCTIIFLEFQDIRLI